MWLEWKTLGLEMVKPEDEVDVELVVGVGVTGIVSVAPSL